MFTSELWNGKKASRHAVNQSIRFNDPDDPALSKTFSGAGTEETWTFSCWIKLGVETSNSRRMIFSAGSAGSNYGGAEIGSAGDNSLEFYNYYGGSYDWRLVTTQQFRDASAWYHLVFVSDTTNAIESDRARIYVNGVRVTNFSGTPSYPARNYANNFWMGTTEHDIGTSVFTTQNFDGYMAEIVNLDGTATDASSFGEFSTDGIWIPKDVSGLTFGTNGFHVDGRDASDLGDDESGNGNDFTTNGLAAHDQVSDSPTNNFCVMNPNDADGLASADELTGGNLQVKNVNRIRSSLPFPTSGKWYWEICTVSKGGQPNWNYGMVYFKNQAEPLLTNNDFIRLNWYHGSNFSSSSNWTDGDFWTNSNNPSAGSVYGFAWDAGTRKVYLAKDGTFFGSADPANGTGTAWGSGGNAGVEYGIAMYSTQSHIHTINFGQDDTFNNAKTSGSATAADVNGNGKFYYAPPTGFLALCTKNLGS
tara:strand:+ start:892 stop:2319 length:1428 start_codon:yes stop_codon:yes gene_type:complete